MSDEECDPLIEELARREVARESLVDFTKYVFPEYEIAWFHRLISHAIDRMKLPLTDPYNIRRLLVTMPPRHGKSCLLSEHLPPYLQGMNPDNRVISCSYSAVLASKFCKTTQRVIASQKYKILFPNTRIMEQGGGTRQRVSDTYTRTSTFYEIIGKKGYYLSSGVGGSITGRGFDWGIIDDPVKNQEEADSPTIRERNLNWYKAVFRTRAEADARIIASATLWNIEDLLSTLLRDNDADLAADKWYVLKFPARAYGQLSPGDPRQDGDWLWPWKYSSQEYEAIQASLGPRAWEALYQCNPTGEGSSEWDAKLFEDDKFFIPDAEWPTQVKIATSATEEFVGGVIAVDPSKGKESKKGDYSFITYLGRTNARRVLGDCWAGRVSAEVLIDNIMDMAKKHKPQWIVGETNSFANLILEALTKRLAREGLAHIRVIPVEQRENKDLRIRRLGPIIASGGWKFRLNNYTRLLQQQLRLFPNSQHDDGPDSAELALRYLVQLINSRYNKQTTVLRV